MKIKKLAALCKKRKRAIIYERRIKDTDIIQQYISDGCAIYPIFGLPQLDAESLLTIFDVDQDEWEKWHVSMMGTPPDVLSQDVWEGEQPVGRYFQPMVINGDLIKTVQIRGETVFFDDAYLDPIRDGENLMYYGRDYGGDWTIIVKSGLLLQAAIFPVRVTTDTWMEMMETMLAGCRRIPDAD